MQRPDEAESLFRRGFVCSQAVLSTFSPSLGLDRDTALRVSAAFGGGMAHMGWTCGAVTGAIMVISLHGTATAVDEQSRHGAYARARELVARFERRHGTVQCRELLGCDIGTAEGLERAKKEDLFLTRCPAFVRDAAVFLEEILAGPP